MAKRRKKSKQKSGAKWLRYGTFFVLILVFLGALGGVAYYFYSLGFEDAKKIQSHKTSFEVIKKKEQEVLSSVLSEVEDYKASQKVSQKQQSKPIKPKPKPSKPHPKKSHTASTHRARLLIIIDDVAYGYQVNAIRSLHLPITPSFFPSSSRHPDTPRYARRFRHYMIHLPLEALHYSREEANTLRITSSYATMDRIVRKIRHDFPRARYVNNHTGSKFTADLSAMRRLISVLDRYHFKFLDSRTTAQTKVPKVMQELGRPYIHRDIFLDNDPSIPAIKAQIKKAVALARKKGLAIAIGHPHKNTIEALRQSKKLLKSVHLIYVDKL